MAITNTNASLGYNPLTLGFKDGRQESARLTGQIAGGVVANDFAGLQKETGAAQQIDTTEASMMTIQQYMTSLKDYALDLGVMDSETTNIFNMAIEFRSTLSNCMNGSTGTTYTAVGVSTAQAIAQQYQAQLAISLNSKSNSGNYLFSGSVINVPPVGAFATNPIALGAANTADISYYKGDAKPLICLIPENQLTLNIQASDPNFEMFFRALRLAEIGDLSDAQVLMDQVTTGINNLNQQINTLKHQAEVCIEKFGEDLQTMKMYLLDTTETDTIAANMQLVDIYAALEAMQIARMQYNKYIQSLLKSQ